MEGTYIALLPIKKNSERVPGKNFKLFHGKPLFRWILDTLIAVEQISQIIINTDAEQELRENGLPQHPKVILRDRKKDIQGDYISMNKVINDDLSATEGPHYIMTHATNPLISVETISKAIDGYEYGLEKGFDSLFSVNKFQSRFYKENGKPLNHDPENLMRTQDLDPLYEENSCLYIFSKTSFKQTDSRSGNNPYMFVTPRKESIDIDDASTWEIAEMLIND